MKLRWFARDLGELTTAALIVPLLSDVSPGELVGFPAKLAEEISLLNEQGDFKGNLNEVALYYPLSRTSNAAAQCRRLILVGMGPKGEWNFEKLRQAVATGLRTAVQRKVRDASVLLPQATTSDMVRDLASIAVMTTYAFSHYKSREASAQGIGELSEITFCAGQERRAKEFSAAVLAGSALGRAVCYSRDLVNQPANIMTPRHLARAAKDLVGGRVTVKVLSKTQIQKKQMGAFLAVAQGSQEEPQLIVAEYLPKNVAQPPTIALVGKGITFDAGGISLKPSDGMEEMKMDMAGGALCLGVIAAAQAVELPVRVVAVVPATENLPSGTATRPGDIVTASNGVTIEVVNTDAEGRLVLADALHYAATEYKPDALIDVATLTGAALVALGHEAAPIMGDQLLVKELEAAAQRTGERVWELPLWQEYKEQVKSEIAEIKNLGEGRKAGVIAGGAFLSYFVPKEIPWVHIDVAGTAMLDKGRRPYLLKGGSGWGVRLLIDFLEHWSKAKASAQ